jgi:hypothetical protein
VGLFGKSTFLESDLEDWSLETWAWLMRNLGGMARLRAAPLVVPSRDYFPPSETVEHERAVYLFELVKKHMGMEGWSCELEARSRPPMNAQVGEFWHVRSGSRPNGTFRIDEGQPIVSYATDLVAKPADLIATLAHELSHYLIATFREPIPGGREVHELTTELTVAYCGFGVFGANHAFSFRQHGDAFSQGWQSSRNGYFSERSWAFALALFSALTGREVSRQWLKPSVADLTAKAGRYLDRHPKLLAPFREAV